MEGSVLMEYKIEIKEEAAQPVLAVRFRSSVTELPAQLGRIYGSIINYIQGSGGTTPLTPYVAYFNMDMQDLDLEAGFNVTEGISGEGDIVASEIPAGKQVSCTHKGPYAASEAAYKEMTEWMQKNQCIPTGVAYEFYLNSPEEVPESELLTKIMFPLK
jgi:effector-binding domain-containing protein